MKALLFVVACLAPFSVSAAPPAGLKAQAESAYQRGVEAFGQEDFAGALEFFDRAFKLDPSPILLYNIARCHEEMGTLDPAIRNFELYLARAPDAPDRGDVERRIRVMEVIARRQADAAPIEQDPPRSAPPPPPPPPTSQPAETSALRWWGYGALGAGVVSLAVGGAMGVAADSAAADHRAANTRADKARFATEANDDATVANVGFIVGGALVAAGATLVIYDVVSDDTAVEVVPAAGGVSVHVRF